MNFLKEFRKAISSAEYQMRANFNEVASVPLNMFDYDGIPEDLREYFEDFEKYLIMGGCLAIGKLDGKYVFVRGGLGGGELDNYGYPTRFIGATGNGKSVDWKVGEDCVVFWNNKSHSPDLDVLKTTDLLTDVDISIDCNIYYSRLYPIPCVKDEKEKMQITEILANLQKGGKNATVINRKKDVTDLVDGKGDEIPVLNITDVSNADKIQYLARFREDVKRWYFNRNGHDLQGSSKMAQQSVEEINNNNSISMIYPLDKYEMRKKAVDEFNELFGENMTVTFSPTLLIEYEKFVRDSIGTEELPEDLSEDLPEEIPEESQEETTESVNEETPEDLPETDTESENEGENEDFHDAIIEASAEIVSNILKKKEDEDNGEN